MTTPQDDGLGPVLPLTLGTPFECTLPEKIGRWAALYPDAPAVIHNDETLTWRALDRRSASVAAALAARGVKPGDRAAILSDNLTDYVVATVGVLRAGATAAPLPTSASEETLRALIGDCRPGCVFASAAYQDVGDRLLAQASDTLKVAIGDGASEGWLPLKALENEAASDAVLAAVEPEAACNIIYSSGTTGVPKGIVHTHRHRAVQSAAFSNLGFTPRSCSLISTPLYSNFSFGAVLVTLWAGGCALLMSRFREEAFLALCRTGRPTHAFIVAVQVERLLRRPEFDASVAGRPMLKYSSGSPMSEATKGELLRRWPGPFVEAYGMTEGGAVSILMAHEHPDKLASVGKPAGETVILGDDDQPLPVGKVGEIAGLAGPAMKGYLNREAASAAMTWESPDGRPFLRSGDLGRLDEDGFLYIVGRKKDMIISGGFNIYPSDIEDVLLRHPEVLEAAVIGVPSERFGETPLALVVTRADSSVGEEDLREWANTRLGKTQRLSGLEFRTDLPRGPIGKVLKTELRAPYWDRPTERA